MRVAAIVLAIVATGCSLAKTGEALRKQDDTAGPAAVPSKAGAAQLAAVLEFRTKLAGAERSALDVGYLANAVRSAVLKAAPGVRVLTRENLLVLLQAGGKKLEECEGECDVETGRRVGADLVVSGDLLRFGSSYKLDLRLHDTHSGELLAGAAASGETVDKLDQAVGPAVRELLAPLRPAATREAQDVAEAQAAAVAPTEVLGFPISASCVGRSYWNDQVFPTRATFKSVGRGPDAGGFHYESVRAQGDPMAVGVEGEFRRNASTGAFSGSAVSTRGEQFSGASPGWQGDTLVERGTMRTAQQETIPYRSTWTRRPRSIGFRLELLLQGRWFTTNEDECRF